MSKRFLTNLDLTQNQLLNFVVQNLPNTTSEQGVKGRMVYSVDTNTIKYHNGTKWVELGTTDSSLKLWKKNNPTQNSVATYVWASEQPQDTILADSVEIPADKVLDRAAINSDNSKLIFTWNTISGKSDTEIPLSDLLPLGTGADSKGLEVTDGKLGVNLKTDGGLAFDTDGSLKVNFPELPTNLLKYKDLDNKTITVQGLSVPATEHGLTKVVDVKVYETSGNVMSEVIVDVEINPTNADITLKVGRDQLENARVVVVGY